MVREGKSNEATPGIVFEPKTGGMSKVRDLIGSEWRSMGWDKSELRETHGDENGVGRPRNFNADLSSLSIKRKITGSFAIFFPLDGEDLISAFPSKLDSPDRYVFGLQQSYSFLPFFGGIGVYVRETQYFTTRQPVTLGRPDPPRTDQHPLERGHSVISLSVFLWGLLGDS
jgi:hypothetical protein